MSRREEGERKEKMMAMQTNGIMEIGDFAKSFYQMQFTHDWNTMSLMSRVMNSDVVKYVNNMTEAFLDAMDYIAKLRQDATGSESFDLMNRARNISELYDNALIQISEQNAKIKEMEMNIRTLESDNHGLFSERATLIRDYLEILHENQKLKAMVYNKGNAEERKKATQFAAADGISGKQKKKVIFMGTEFLGWDAEYITERFGLGEQTIRNYINDGRKMFNGLINVDGQITLSWKDGCSDDDIPVKTVFTPDEYQSLTEVLTGLREEM